MVNIKLTTSNGVSYPNDLQGLNYQQAVEQLNLLEQPTGIDDFEADRQGEDILCLNYSNGDFKLYEIV